MKTNVVIALFALVASGCLVSKSKHEALQKKLTDTEADMAQKMSDCDAKVKDLKANVAHKEGEVRDLGAKNAKLDGTVSQLNAEIESDKAEIDRIAAEKSRLEGDLAAVVSERSRLRASAKEMKQALSEASRRRAEAERRVAQFRQLLVRFQALIDAGRLQVRIRDGKMVLELPTDVLFDSGKAQLSEPGRLAIEEVAKVLVTLRKRKFQVEGHTDNVPIKTSRFPSNWELAAARAIVVVKTMVAAGMDGARVSAASYGEHSPIANNDTAGSRTRNRRIQIVVVPDLSSLPGFDELRAAVSK